MNINEAIAIYTESSARAAELKKAADVAKKIILAAMGDNDELTTDIWTVYAKRTQSFRLDTAALYKDFPDIKESYGKASVSVSIDAHARTAESVKPA